MPFRSLAQERFLYANHPSVAAKFAADGASQPGVHLPEHVGKTSAAAAYSQPPGPHGQSVSVHTQNLATKHPVVSSPWVKMKTGEM